MQTAAAAQQQLQLDGPLSAVAACQLQGQGTACCAQILQGMDQSRAGCAGPAVALLTLIAATHIRHRLDNRCVVQVDRRAGVPTLVLLREVELHQVACH